MTSPLSRTRSRRATSSIAVRVAHTVLGGLAALGWLLLPVARPGPGDSAEWRGKGPVVEEVSAAPGQGGTSADDLVLPVAAVVVAGSLAAYASVRRIRRARTRTTPGKAVPGTVPLAELDRLARQSLVGTDDCVRTSAEELESVAALFGREAVGAHAEAVAFARSELMVAFRLRQRLDDTAPDDEEDQRRTLEEIRARCAEAGRRLDAEAPGFDLLRALERSAPAALESAEARFRGLARRTPAAQATLAGLHERYAASAYLPVAGHVEQAKDRLVFATTHLNRARQSLDRSEVARAAAYLRAAEGAIGQADVLLTGVDRLAAELDAAAVRLPAALARADTDLERARAVPAGAVGGALAGRVAHTGSVVADVRREAASGPYDPFDALRRVVRAAATLVGTPALGRDEERDLALLDEACPVARGAVMAADDFVTTHRAVVGSEARTRLAEAQRRLALSSLTFADVQRADALAGEARRLAERDVRTYGNPYGGPGGDGVRGAVLGGILRGGSDPGGSSHPGGDLPGDVDSGDFATAGDAAGGDAALGVASFGGPRTRYRRAVSAPAPVRTGSATPPPGP
ncbi:TPM domain-containing protein [Streptomyces sp. LN704]|uniref:TPM domain-containing protein n=1 Tax=Streptomyces sp. LN704 TaxID=3112982 RepID=UPI00371C67C8